MVRAVANGVMEGVMAGSHHGEAGRGQNATDGYEQHFYKREKNQGGISDCRRSQAFPSYIKDSAYKGKEIPFP